MANGGTGAMLMHTALKCWLPSHEQLRDPITHAGALTAWHAQHMPAKDEDVARTA
jgi:hypothetical protein